MKKKPNTPYCCEMCQNTGEWQGEKLALHVDHVDGDRLNNADENLRYLCPNCHSQTATYCGRNKARQFASYENLTLEHILESAKGEETVSGVMRKLNLNTNNAYAREKLRIVLDTHLALVYIPSQDQYEKLAYLKASGIDFLKRGWVNEAARILKMEPYSVKRWLARNFPDFLVSCYARKINKKKLT